MDIVGLRALKRTAPTAMVLGSCAVVGMWMIRVLLNQASMSPGSMGAWMLGALLMAGLTAWLSNGLIGHFVQQGPMLPALKAGSQRAGTLLAAVGRILCLTIVAAGVLVLGMYITIAGTIDPADSASIRLAKWLSAATHPTDEFRWTFYGLLILGAVGIALCLPGVVYRMLAAWFQPEKHLRIALAKEITRRYRLVFLLRLVLLVTGFLLLSLFAQSLQAWSTRSFFRDVDNVYLMQLLFCIPKACLWVWFWGQGVQDVKSSTSKE